MVKKKISHWYDGDSGRFADGKQFRLVGVRAPEIYQYGGQEATRKAAAMTSRSQNIVDVRPVGVDSFGRELVQMRNQGGSVNGRLRRFGYTNKGR